MKMFLNKKYLLLYIVISLFIVGGISFTLAKYTDEIKSNHLQASSKFFFTSNYLETDEKTFEIYKDSINIELYNYDVNNINNITTADIVYNTSIKYYDESNNMIGEELTTTNNSSWIDDTIGKKSIFVLNSIENASYALVSISSASLYSKELKGRFNFNGGEYIPVYSVNKLTNGFTIKIMTANENINNISLTWPSVCGPDNTNPLMSSWTNDAHTNSLTMLNANTTYTLNFYCTLEVTNVVEVSDQVLDGSIIEINLQ